MAYTQENIQFSESVIKYNLINKVSPVPNYTYTKKSYYIVTKTCQ